MIALGVALQRYMGIAPRKQHFRDREDDSQAVNEIHDDAVVLRTYKSGEADRVVVLWTATRQSARAGEGCAQDDQPPRGDAGDARLREVDLVKTRGEFYIARHVAHLERLATLRGSYSRISAGYAVVERSTRSPLTASPTKRSSNCLTRVLLTLDDERYEPALVPASFFFRLLTLDGSEPVVDRCVNCERSGPTGGL